MIVNFKTRKISWDARKLIQIPTLIKKNKASLIFFKKIEIFFTLNQYFFIFLNYFNILI